jgi:hypothetical protein
MRTMMKVTIPVENGNKAIKDGSLPKLVQSLGEANKLEASYFYTETGRRTMLFVLDMKDASQIPPLAESFFMNLNAEVQFFPVMNAEDLKSGLEKVAGRRNGRVHSNAG